MGHLQGALSVFGDVVDAVGDRREEHEVRRAEHGEGVHHVRTVGHPDVDVLPDAGRPLQVDLQFGADVVGVEGGQDLATPVLTTVLNLAPFSQVDISPL